MTTLTKIEKAIEKTKLEINKATSIDDRYEVFAAYLSMQNLRFERVGEKPAKGASFSIIKLKRKYRVNIRCGYGKHNYAPCVEVLNED